VRVAVVLVICFGFFFSVSASSLIVALLEVAFL